MSDREPNKPVQINLRISAEQEDSLDALVADINATGVWPKVNRTDVLRRLLDHAVEHRPAFLFPKRKDGAK